MNCGKAKMTITPNQQRKFQKATKCWICGDKLVTDKGHQDYEKKQPVRDENIGDQLLVEIQRDSFKINLASLTGITSAINTLNIKLQSQKQSIGKMVGILDAFKAKWSLLKSSLSKANFYYFLYCFRRLY